MLHHVIERPPGQLILLTSSNSDKQTGMADNFSKTLSKTAGVPKTLFETKTSPIFSFFSQNTLMLSDPRGGPSILNIVRFAIPSPRHAYRESWLLYSA